MESPAGTVRAAWTVADDGQLTWTLQRGESVAIEPSPAGITVGGTDLGRNVTLGDAEMAVRQETFPWLGGKRTATNHCRAYRVPVLHAASGIAWTLETRVFDDGFAYRYRVPGAGRRSVRREASGWVLPAGAQVWFQTDTRNYEGVYESARVQDIPTTRPTDEGPRPVRLGPPLTAELGSGLFVLIIEANLARYSGLTLEPTGTRLLKAIFEDDPDGFRIEGEIVTPWRTTLVVSDLNALVNSDVVPSLADPPDPALFPNGPNADWIRPGRALVTWCVFGNDGAQWRLQKWFVDQCAALHCEYLLVDGGWRSERWGFLSGGADPWMRLEELCRYAAARDVGIVVWNAFPEGREDGPGLTQPEAREEFFRRCRQAGVKGVKIDFFDSESGATIEAYTDLARRAAEHKLMINFHGANKPTGEPRTWPHEITREGIREQEYLLWEQLPLPHYAALPFTRLAVGHGDFLPGYVRSKYLKNTSAVFQMATAVLATSPFLCWPDHPDDYRASPFLGLVQSMPTAWDETHVLPGSAIGKRVAFARRHGLQWFVAAINTAPQAEAWTLDLDFLPATPYTGTLYRDVTSDRTRPVIETGQALTAQSSLPLELPSGGGFVGWLIPTP